MGNETLKIRCDGIPSTIRNINPDFVIIIVNTSTTTLTTSHFFIFTNLLVLYLFFKLALFSLIDFSARVVPGILPFFLGVAAVYPFALRQKS